MAGITHLKELSTPALKGLVDAMENERLEVQDGITNLLPREDVYSTEFAYDVIKKSNQLAGMIGFGAEPPVRDKDEVARRMGELAKFGIKDAVTEEELLQLNNPRTQQEHASLIDALITKGADNVKSVQDQIDVLRAQALTTGKVDYDKNNVKVSIDFTGDMPDNHKVVSGDSVDWADTDHDVIGDLIQWVQDYEENSGKEPDTILVTREIQALMLKNAAIVAEIAGPNTAVQRVSSDAMNSVLGGYGLPSVTVIRKTKATVRDIFTGKDETVELMPKNRLVMASQGVGSFMMGPTVENSFQPGIVLQAYDKQEPIQSVFRAVAAGFPVVKNPNLLFHADVYEA